MKTNRNALKTILYCFTFLFALLNMNGSRAQTVHPVTASLQLIPPYSVYLPDYASPGNDKLRVILTLNDLSQPSYTVRLRLKVELNGRLIMQTDPAYRPSAITLLPGMPQIISGAQLSEYLVSDHLQFLNGFSRDNYERTKSLPEGAYRICVTAYDYNRSDDVTLSNDGCNIFFFQKNEAPLLNYPLCNSRVERKNPQFLTFSWTVRNSPSYVSGSSGTGYRFELYEVRPAGSNAEYIVRSSTPIFTTTTDAAMLNYGPAEPQLQDSMQYVWRVQAYDKDGRDAYQNNGYSQACVFTYGGIDPFAANNVGKPELLGEALGERSGKWWWHFTGNKIMDGWNIQYRKKSDSGSKTETYDWNNQYTTDTLLHLFNLEPDNTYEARVQPVMNGINGSWSETVAIRTFPKRVYECGKNDTSGYGLGQSSAAGPLYSATAGMVIRVGDFDMQLLDVSGGNGRFSGYGAVTTPLLGLRLNVKFTDAVINNKLQLTQGVVTALTEGIDAWIQDRKKTQKDVETIKNWDGSMPDFETASLGEIENFAKELLSISDGVWSDTYVYTDAERKEMQDALVEIQAAMKDLQDNDPSNDAAAEKKLRGTLKKEEPLLEKLSNNIGKGVAVKVNAIIRNLSDGIKQLLSSSIKDDNQALADLESQVKALAEKELPKVLLDSLKIAIQQMADAKTAYDAALLTYNNATGDEQKLAAKEKMDAADKQYEDAKQILRALQKEKEGLVNSVADVIVTAVKQIRKENENDFSEIDKYQKERTAAINDLYKSQGLDNSKQPDGSMPGVLVFIEEKTLDDADRKAFIDKSNEWRTRAKKVKGIVVYKAFTEFFSTSQNVSDSLLTDRHIAAKALVDKLIEKQMNNEPKESMIVFAHDYLVDELKKYINSVIK